MKEAPLSYKKSADSWQMKVQQFTKLPFPLPWLLIAGVLFGIGYVIARFCEEDLSAIRFCAINAALIAAIANAVVFFEMLLDQIADAASDLLKEDEEKAQEWIRKWYDNIFWSKKNIFAGLVLGTLIVVARLVGGNSLFTSMAGNIYAYFINFAIGVTGGSMFWAMLGIAGLMLSLGKDVNIKPSIFDTSTSSLRTASSVLWKVSFIAALTYILGVSQIFLCSIEIDTLSKIIIVFFGTFVVLYFIVPQINIHKTLLRLKRERLGALVKQIDNTFDDVSKNPTPTNINQLRKLFDLQHVVNGKKSWSFGATELLILLGTVLIPLILFILECLIRSKLKQ